MQFSCMQQIEESRHCKHIVATVWDYSHSFTMHGSFRAVLKAISEDSDSVPSLMSEYLQSEGTMHHLIGIHSSL